MTGGKSLGSDAMLGAMALVTGIRLVFQGTAIALAYPVAVLVQFLPEKDGPAFPRLSRVITRVQNWCGRQLPAWAEYKGGFMIVLKTSMGAEKLDAVVERVPEALMRRWTQFGIATMVLFTVVWSGILVIGLSLVLRDIGLGIARLLDWAIRYDWTLPQAPDRSGSLDIVASLGEVVSAIPELAYALGMLAIAFGVALAFSWLVMLFLLPGLTIHEFGHYAAARTAGASVESYGLLLFGPVLGGAFVEPGDDADDLPARDQFRIWSAGIANTVLFGTALLVAGTIVAGDPATLFQALYAHEYAVLATQPVSAVLIAGGVMEVANGFLNAAPMGPVDGGGFTKTVEEQWWGFDESVGYTDRLRYVLGAGSERGC